MWTAMDMKSASLVIMCLQNGATPLIMRWATTGALAADRFDTGEAVLVQEFLKIILSLVLLVAEEQWSVSSTAGTLRAEVLDKPRDTLKLAVPAVLYFVLNVCLQLASAELEFGFLYLR
jgi:UDP-sugar transporter A1/2/3